MSKPVVEVHIRAIGATSGGCAVFLGNEDKVFVMFVDQSVGMAITMFMQGIKKERPLTHDLIANILRALGAKIERVIINDLKSGTYFARLVLSAENESQQKKIIEIDARPSDCIAMATAQRAPIYVSLDVWDEVEDMTEEFRKMQEEGSCTGKRATRKRIRRKWWSGRHISFFRPVRLISSKTRVPLGRLKRWSATKCLQVAVQAEQSRICQHAIAQSLSCLSPVPGLLGKDSSGVLAGGRENISWEKPELLFGSHRMPNQTGSLLQRNGPVPGIHFFRTLGWACFSLRNRPFSGSKYSFRKTKFNLFEADEVN